MPKTMKSKLISCLLYSLSLVLFYYVTSSHACNHHAQSGSLLWELHLAKLATISSKTSTIAILHSRNESFSFKLSWDLSTLNFQASIVKSVAASFDDWHVWTSGALFHLSTPLCLHLEKNGSLVLKQGDSLLWESHTCGFDVKCVELLGDSMLILKRKRAINMVWQRSRQRKISPIRQVQYTRRALQEIRSRQRKISPIRQVQYARRALQEIRSRQRKISPNQQLKYTRRALQEIGSNDLTSNYNGSSIYSNPSDGGHRNKGVLAMEIIFPVAAFLALALCLALQFFRRRKAKARQINGSTKSKTKDDEALLESLAPGLPPRFTYAEMEEATSGFQKKLGQGGYGTVYEGILPTSGTRVAVKVFIDTSSTACRKGFVAEVMSIGEKKHQNLVQLRGFCVEEDHRMLVYELMEKGSLNKLLFGAKAEKSKGLLLSWERRRAIAIDTARALAFLHEEGEQGRSVIHCDVKPENILLNENWVAKVSDFGLAKLLWSTRHHEEDDGHFDGTQTSSTFDGPSTWDTSKISSLSGLISSKGVRGTLGYLAPEWVRVDAGPDTISTASDVYSFGVVLLELIAGRRSMVPGHPFLLGHAFDMIANKHDLSSLLDPYLHNTCLEDLEDVRNFANIALWCLQEDVSLRPTMENVLNMLTNKESVSPPPFCDYFAGSSHFFDEGDHHLHQHTFSSTTSTSHDKGLETSTTTSYENSSWQNSILSGR